MNDAAPNSTPGTTAASTAPMGLILFGRDVRGKAHASRFAPAEAALAEKAAGLMRMRVLPLVSAELDELAAKIPAGRVFASGSAFVPFCSDALFTRLAAAPEAFTPTPPPDGEHPPVMPRRPKGKHSAQTAGKPAGDAEEPAGGPGTLPADWDGITVGSLVLASEGPMEGWFEAVAVEQRGDDLFVLRWRDWPDQPQIVRRRDHLGLLPPTLATQG